MQTVEGAAFSAPVGSGELLERSRDLCVLSESLAAVSSGAGGRLVLVGGEAGVGKTVLIRRFCEEHRGSARVLWGACDALFTPRPLGPLFDIAEITGDGLAELVASGAKPHEVSATLVRELASRTPTILVLEDVHWADEATLDVLRLLGRRVESAPALVLVTYRDDELERAHPLRILLGELATGQAIDRLTVECLSPTAVAMLAEPHRVNAADLYRKTAGNPFFVTEVLAAGEEEIPRTVRDAVLARAGRLSHTARNLLDAVAVVPLQVELWLLEALAGDAVQQLEECLASGMLTPVPGGLAFRHELARLAVEESLAPNRRVALHERAVGALATPPAGAPDLARLAHHAEAAGDAAAVLRFAPAAGKRAALLGAHREAGAQYARALRFADGLALATRAELLERFSNEGYLTDMRDDAVGALHEALDCHRQLDDRLKEGDTLRLLARLLACPGRNEEARGAAREAVAVLEQLPPSRELALAYAALSHVSMLACDSEPTVVWGTRALELAQRLGDTETMVNALNNIGTVEICSGLPEGREKLERSLELAKETGLGPEVGRAYINLSDALGRRREWALADPYIEAGIDYCRDHGLEAWLACLVAAKAESELARGRWAEAADISSSIIEGPPGSVLSPRVTAQTVLGLVRARRGDPGAWPPLDEARSLAERSGDLQFVAPVAAARAETAWLEGSHDVVVGETAAAFGLALELRGASFLGELARWRRRAGIDEETPPALVGPYALELAGDWAGAAEAWGACGCPYDAALALADADDEDALRLSLDELHRLGARPAAAIVARRLRERGARGVPRGPRPETRQNPANLTPRELEVLVLLVQGLHNAEIAERLFLSEKTVDHHVSAILRKLGVRSRGQASTEAVRLGLAGQDR